MHLRSAHGYIELGMFDAANAELEQIDPLCRHLPEVLLARLGIYHGLKKWELPLRGTVRVHYCGSNQQNRADFLCLT